MESSRPVEHVAFPACTIGWLHNVQQTMSALDAGMHEIQRSANAEHMSKWDSCSVHLAFTNATVDCRWRTVNEHVYEMYWTYQSLCMVLNFWLQSWKNISLDSRNRHECWRSMLSNRLQRIYLTGARGICAKLDEKNEKRQLLEQ